MAEINFIARKLVNINMLKVIWDKLYGEQEKLGLFMAGL